MKIVTQDGKTYEFYKRELEIVRVVRLENGTREFVGKDDFLEHSVCNFEWSLIKGESVDKEHPWAVISRSEAQDLQLNKYYTGRTCKRKHISQRYTTTGLCIACVSARARKFSKAARETPEGMVLLEEYIHPDDVKAMRALADSLKAARALTGGA